jgi:creatinine amidohydrolase
MRRTLLATLFFTALGLHAQTAMDLSDLNWMEFAQLVPGKIQTVLLPTGTVEAHGVIHNGADGTAPLDLARAMAPKLNALVAPLVPYGVTGTLDGYPGTFQVSEASYRLFMTDILTGLARNGFRNIVIINGHGGPQSAILNDIAEKVGREQRVRTLVTNWWAICSDVTMKVFGEDGGHAGWNETAFTQAVHPKLVHPELYRKDLEAPRLPAGSWTAFPHPTPIILYQPNQGSPKFDQKKAEEYFTAVVVKMTETVRGVIELWDKANIFPAAPSASAPRP